MHLPDVIACVLCPLVWTPTPQLPPGARARYFPGGIGLAHSPSWDWLTRHSPQMQLRRGVIFRDCSHSLMFRLADLLGPLIAPTAPVARRAAGPYTPRRT